LALTQGLVGWWQFTEGEGNIAHDYSGKGNNGTLVNNPTWTKAFNGAGALSFNAANSQYVWLGSPASLQVTSISVASWFKTTSSQPMDIYRWLYNGVELGLNQGNVQFFFFDSNKQYTVTSPSTYNDGSWHQAVGTYDGTNVKLYVDGVLVATRAITDTIFYGSGGAAIGREGAIASNYFNGLIADVRIYNYALPPSEITQLYHQRPPQLEYTVTSSATYNLNYYVQDSINATFTVTAGTGYTPPSISIVSLGQQLSNLYTLSQTSYSEFWVDQGSTISVTNPLPGSTFLQSWSTPNSPAIVTQPGIYDPVYDGGVCPTNQNIGNTNLGTMLMLAVLPIIIVASLIVFALMRMGQGISIVPVLVVIGISILLVIGVIIISNVTNTLGTVAGC
jgi:hypothetical protein